MIFLLSFALSILCGFGIEQWIAKQKNFLLYRGFAMRQVEGVFDSECDEADVDLVVQNDAKSTDNRINHQFQIFSKKSLDQASGIDQLVTQIVKEGIL